MKRLVVSMGVGITYTTTGALQDLLSHRHITEYHEVIVSHHA